MRRAGTLASVPALRSPWILVWRFSNLLPVATLVVLVTLAVIPLLAALTLLGAGLLDVVILPSHNPATARVGACVSGRVVSGFCRLPGSMIVLPSGTAK